ncbi:hypothetical protein MOQ72_16745 [Saccharopolyspora sp. K220]|uniref:hypothetical protein n=1 Tax=Saccharopolyspora soli TaxID=2926618 RepID=UPI001F55E567|nr:hypothetical protein [Saccharopolyspora soli]MCI2419095.1 hypothetical protein [Saccharopolyspora soli]
MAALSHVLDMLDPGSWHTVRDPAGDKQSWVRLWADQPTYPLPPRDAAAGPDEQPRHDVLADVPDLRAVEHAHRLLRTRRPPTPTARIRWRDRVLNGESPSGLR